MSQENVEVVRRGFEAFQRGGAETLLERFLFELTGSEVSKLSSYSNPAEPSKPPGCPSKAK